MGLLGFHPPFLETSLCFTWVDEIRLWTLHDGRFARALPGGGSLTALAFSTAGAAKIASATQKLGGTKRYLNVFFGEVGSMLLCFCWYWIGKLMLMV